MRAKLFTLVILAATATAQTTIVYTWNVQAAPTDTAVPIKTTQDAATAGPNFLFSIPAPGTSPTTLTSGVSSAATTFPLASTTGLAPGMGICISPSAQTCTITMSTSVTLSTGEVARITAVSGLNVTVTRGSIGTAAAYLTGQAVTILRSGSYSDLVANIVRDFYAQVIANPSYGSASSITGAAAIAAAQATLTGNASLPH